MAPRRHDLAGSSLLAVLAHPDDESLACGGLLALCADAGARVSLLCLTRGERGRDGRARGERGRGEAGRDGRGERGRGDSRRGERRRAEPAGPVDGRAPESLGDVRARELLEAARILDIHDVLLLEHEDGMLPWIERAALEADVLDAIRRIEPDVVITFDRDGLYWHPDHVAVHERVTAAVAGMGGDRPALLYASMPRGTMRALVEAGPRGDPHVLGITDVDVFGAMAPEPTLVVDAGAVAARKLAALRCHRTQVEGSVLDFLDERDAPRLLGTEHYRRAEIGAHAAMLVERLGTRVAATRS